jgi:L-lysine exporter family protein LysE/ArgO
VVVLQGLLAGLSLIVAIGAQNAFVLRQGLRGEHVGAVVAVCTGADLVLIGAGTAGLGALVGGHPAALAVARFAGAALLVVLGAAAVRRAPALAAPAVAADAPAPVRTVLATTLGLTLLNPHVYLDTVLLLGAMAAQHGALRWAFAAGAGAASALWFTGLGFGAVRLRPLLARPGAWRVLDLAVAAVMLVLAARLTLLTPALTPA